MIERFAVIADIHGNSDALSAVLSEIDGMGIPEIINLGDHFSGPLDPSGTADILAKRAMRSIRGNHDRRLISVGAAEMGPSDQNALGCLPGAAMDWLTTLPPMLSLNDEIFACHGTPFSDSSYWVEEVTAQGQVQKSTQSDIEAKVEGLNHQVFLCGHSHLSNVVKMRAGQVLVNPGSVGCPAYTDTHPVTHKIETGTAQASFAVLEKQTEGWSAALHLVAYDTARMASCARSNGREDWVQAVKTGRVN